MTNVYIDTEFNGHGGELISMALVTQDGREWYESLPLSGDINPWVSENVIPKLNRIPLSPEMFKETLFAFIKAIEDPIFIADTAVDIKHLCTQFEGETWADTLQVQMRCYVLPDAGTAPENPHNALSDAHALRSWHQRLTKDR